jgi:peptidoglycan/LPS O-acetylase OafA/YrhL
MGLPTLLHIPFVNDLCQTAVTCFFALSGFLITYLLFAEKDKKGHIDIKAFYFRRLLRIWPVYYTVLLAGLLLWPHLWPFSLYEHTQTLPLADNLGKLGFFVGLLANVAYVLPSLGFFIPHLWSVGVEEQFYIFWPWLIRNNKRYLLVLLAVIGIYLIAKFLPIGMRYLSLPGSAAYDFWNSAFLLVGITRFSCMAIGGLGAYVIFFKSKAIKPFFGSYAPVVTALVFILFVGADAYVPYLKYEMQSYLFVLVLMSMTYHPARYTWLDWGPLNYLGRVSYGIYMYHLVPAAFCTFVLVQQVPVGQWSAQHDVLLYLGATLGTIGFSALSYQFLEKPFLALKGRFEKVKSSV